MLRAARCRARVDGGRVIAVGGLCVRVHAHARSTVAAGFQCKHDSSVWGWSYLATGLACGSGKAVPRARAASPLRWVHRRDPRSPPSAASLLQANVVCVVYDVTKEATIEKVTGPLLEP